MAVSNCLIAAASSGTALATCAWGDDVLDMLIPTHSSAHRALVDMLNLLHEPRRC
jgi:hypothetical protein